MGYPRLSDDHEDAADRLEANSGISRVKKRVGTTRMYANGEGGDSVNRKPTSQGLRVAKFTAAKRKKRKADG
jgi:hypothetical protein